MNDEHPREPAIADGAPRDPGDDGQSNPAESWAGTDPQSADCVFRFAERHKPERAAGTLSTREVIYE